MRKTIIIILILALCSGMLMYIFGRKNLDNNALPSGQNQAILEAERIEAEAWSKALKSTESVDKDFDGLVDSREKQLGTNLESADTDKDGVSDSNEADVYKTNPLKADTDGDGVPDGIEIRRGTNPNKK